MEPDHSPKDRGEPRIVRGSALDALQHDPSSRSTFLRMMGGGGAAVALGTLLSACGDDDDDSASTGGSTSTPDAEATPADENADAAGDLEIVNYALTLEYLEAAFYPQVIDSRAWSRTRRRRESPRRSARTSRTHVDALDRDVEELGGTPPSRHRRRRSRTSWPAA